MQTILDFTSTVLLSAILLSAIGGAAGAFIGLTILHEVRCYRIRKNVLKAIKDLNLEDELARCPAIDAKLYIAIKTYLREHGFRDPFIGPGSAFDMTVVIAELRKKGKIKPLEPVTNIDEPVKKDSSENPVVLFRAGTYHRWLSKWGFKKNLNMLQLMQYRLDEYQGDYSLLVRDSVYARLAANEYLVTLHGEYVFVDANTLTKMEADFYTEKVSPNSHLIAIPKDWVDEMVNKHPELVLTDVD